MYCLAISVLIFLPYVSGKCLTTYIPLDPAVVGKRRIASHGCSPGGNSCDDIVSIKRYGVIYEPNICVGSIRYNTCLEHIVILFGKNENGSIILYRPAHSAINEPKKYPEALKARLRDSNDFSMCNLIPVQRITSWGPERNKFISLVRRLVRGIKRVRDFNCDGIYGNPNAPKTRSDVEYIVESHQVCNAALNFLYYTAHANLFCI